MDRYSVHDMHTSDGLRYLVWDSIEEGALLDGGAAWLTADRDAAERRAEQLNRR